MGVSKVRRPPRWLKFANRLNIAMLSRGIGPAAQHVLTIPGRTTGLPRRTPIATVELNGSTYIVAGFAGSDWVRNARASGGGVLARGSNSTSVTLIELSIDERSAVLREFLRTVRGGRSFLTVGARASQEELAAAASDHPVFRIE